MTTIAWDGRTLAGDAMTTWGGTPMRACVPKVHKVTAPNGRKALVGFSGSLAYGNAYLAWLNGGDKPDPKVPESTGWTVIMVDDEGGIWQRSDTSDAWTLLGRRVNWACGSGADYALGAMAAGATAEQAVKIASNLDTNTGFGVHAVRLS